MTDTEFQERFDALARRWDLRTLRQRRYMISAEHYLSVSNDAMFTRNVWVMRGRVRIVGLFPLRVEFRGE